MKIWNIDKLVEKHDASMDDAVAANGEFRLLHLLRVSTYISFHPFQ